MNSFTARLSGTRGSRFVIRTFGPLAQLIQSRKGSGIFYNWDGVFNTTLFFQVAKTTFIISTSPKTHLRILKPTFTLSRKSFLEPQKMLPQLHSC
jgi:hypothetical protein